MIQGVNILVADDSKLVVQTVSNSLKQLGVNSDRIFFAYKPNEVLSICKENNIDMIVLDYNFNSYLNGCQILHELRNRKYISELTSVTYITGENDAKIVRSLIDTEPDGFILKPFNQPQVKRKIYSIFKKRIRLKFLYESIANKNYLNAINICDELLCSFPMYYIGISHLKAKCLIELKSYQEAKVIYENLILKYNNDWMKAKLANVLYLLGEDTKSISVLESIINKESNYNYHDEMANLKISQQDLPAAIEHLKCSVSLLDDGLKRYLIIANLSLASGDYKGAFDNIRTYLTKNSETSLIDDRLRLKYIQYFLYMCYYSSTINNFDSALVTIENELNQVSKNEELSIQYDLIELTISCIKGRLNTCSGLIKKITTGLSLSKEHLDFYDMYHLIFIFQIVPNNISLQECEQLCHFLSKSSPVKNEVMSNIYMLDFLLCEYNKKLSFVKECRQKILNAETSYENYADIINVYQDIFNLFPYSLDYSLSFVKFVSLNRVNRSNARISRFLLQDRNIVISNFITRSKMKDIGYEQLYVKALNNIE